MDGTAQRVLSRRDLMLRILEAGSAAALLGASAWTPRFFNAAQNRTLAALGESLIPGSTEAQCNRFIDLMMTIESETNRKDLLAALEALDGAAQSRFHKGIDEIAANSQDELLTLASAPGDPLHAQFDLVKEWMADAYWSSQEGLRELGWTGRLAWDSFPDCGGQRPHN